MKMEQAFLQAIHENPVDEVSWSALTDWLEEQGDERGELLRLHRTARQSLTALGEPTADCHAWMERVHALLAQRILPCVPNFINSVGMELVLIPPGSFRMGSPPEEPGRDADELLHPVTITRPYYLGAFPVTQEQYEAVMGENPSHFTPTSNGQARVRGLDTRNFPVEMVCWARANSFCEALSALPEERRAGRVYRLPTEAEWEYACREAGPCTTAFHQGPVLCSTQANCRGTEPDDGNPPGPFLRRTTHIGSYPPNALGLYDLHGNVWEWCQDWYDSYDARKRKDPRGPRGGNRVVVRGGGWDNSPRDCRTANRDYWYGTVWNTNYIGFRVACNQGSGR